MKLKIGLLIIIILSTGCSFSKNTDSTISDEKHTSQIFAMNTVMDITVYDANGKEAIDAAEKKIRELEELFSVNRPESDLYRINHNKDNKQPVPVSEDTFDLIRKSIELSKKTSGLFDISIYPIVKAWGFTDDKYVVPNKEERKELSKLADYRKIECKNGQVSLDKGMQLDLGGIAKGYAADQVIDLFREMGIRSAIVSLGGDVKSLGKKPDGTSFDIAVKHPLKEGDFLDVIQADNKAVVTSGSYERFFEKKGVRYHHIMDKQTAAPANSDLISVTVIADHGTDADVLSTAVYIMGSKKAAEFHKETGGFDMILVKKDGNVAYLNQESDF
ncbi:MAG: FAD:protein FMN transferase [Lachnoclostridium sp.]|nr:FAD:protein FMN transferase [Lachnoclostridium sp.]